MSVQERVGDDRDGKARGLLAVGRDHVEPGGPPSLKELAVDLIRADIVAGRLKPGAKIDQDSFALRLGISRLPIREALIELAAHGYVNALPRRGAYVIQLTVEDIQDHFEVLGMLFGLAARRAAIQLTDEQLDELRALEDRIRVTPDTAEHDRLSVGFYRIINAAGSSQRLLATLRFLALALPNDLYTTSEAWAELEAAYRVRILDALIARDIEASARLAEEHLGQCGKVVVELLHDRGYWADRSEA